MLRLTTYFRSTAAYRVRIALNLKGIEHELIPINLLADGGEHKTPNFLDNNPDGLIPTLEVDSQILAQSMAILEFLEERYPEPALLPSDQLDRAYLRGLSQTITSDIHPLNNLRVQQFLVSEMGLSETQKSKWYHHWLAAGFKGLETRLSSNPRTGKCCYGDQISLADVCLIPQVYNAHRFNCPMNEYPTIQAINEHCLQLESFARAAPHLQADAK